MCPEKSKNNKLFIRYYKEDEVVEKNQIFLVFKGAFLAKLKQIDSNGQNINFMQKLDKWLDAYVDEHYKSNNHYNFTNQKVCSTYCNLSPKKR